MNSYCGAVNVFVIAVAGVFLGWAFSKLQKHWWLLGYFLPASLIVILAAARWSNTLLFVPPFCWFTAGQLKFAVISFAVTTGLTTPLSRLPYKFEKWAVCVLMVVVVSWFAVLPFLTPVLIEDHLNGLHTIMDSQGNCFQSEDYTCGPAAAVTALRKLGLPAEEGEIAVLARTNPISGTLPYCLYTAIQGRYGADGLKCCYRPFDSVAQLKGAGLILAVVRSTLFSDHCVAVLSVADGTVTFADPVRGRRSMSYEQFGKVWRFAGIVLKRESVDNI